MEGQSTIYISGALCAFSAAECIGQDTSDYPWDTVPLAAERVFRSQQYHDRRQRQYRMQSSPAERAQMTSPRDFFQPIVADGDMGFGTATATMKLTKRMVEAGVAMFHLDDLALGGKSWTGGEGHTVVSTAEYLKRLAAARLQLDIMACVKPAPPMIVKSTLTFDNHSAETMIICRCDTYDAQWITSNHDPRDQPYILGATVPLRPAASSYATPEERSAWDKEARLMTFDDNVKASATTAQYSEYTTLLAQKAPASLAD